MKILNVQALTDEFNSDNCKTETLKFVRTIANDYQVALTLTLKQKWFYKNGAIKNFYYSNSIGYEHIQYIYERFEHQLNKQIWKQKYYRHKTEKLKFFKVWENGKGTKNLHFHGALGNFPKGFKFGELSKHVEAAAKQCCELDVQHKEELCDCGWLKYITKEVENNNTDNILW